jgi:hypothetical protein
MGPSGIGKFHTIKLLLQEFNKPLHYISQYQEDETLFSDSEGEERSDEHEFKTHILGKGLLRSSHPERYKYQS